MKRAVMGCATVLAFALGGGMAMGTAAAAPGLPLEPAPANSAQVAAPAAGASTGSANALLPNMSICPFSADFAGCDGMPW
ncbi:hypothetical protein [Nocardia australiensis]|uniref:hypothetical protein n=1 Tax=Nocardia australiensis TaxID=2887191 RepID=UPI001D14C350|nr:hypothetical protein [Nocardia australiensis]